MVVLVKVTSTVFNRKRLREYLSRFLLMSPLLLDRYNKSATKLKKYYAYISFPFLLDKP